MYSDINSWWRGEGVCSNSGWRLEREMKEERRKEEEEKLIEANNNNNNNTALQGLSDLAV